MKGKVCIVTGATRGIGRAVLELFVERGAQVIGTYLSSKTEAESICIDHPVEMHRSDIRKRGDTQQLCEHVGRIYGKIDVVVNNAGHWEKGDVATIKRGQVEDMFAAHCHGPMWMVKYALPVLSNGSSIVNITSNGALRGGAKAPHYAAANGALISWTKSLSKILAPKTRINAVAGGIIDTGMLPADTSLKDIPMNRWGTPKDMAYAVEFLASESAGYITGQTFVVDGGQHV